jgi:DNA-binding NarL/FixJ family response regulator
MQTQFRVPPSQPSKPKPDKSTPFIDAVVEDAELSAALFGAVSDATLQVAIICDQRVVRDGLLRILDEFLKIHVVASYTGSPDDNTRSVLCDILLLDSNVGAESSLAWIAFWRSAVPPIPVLVMGLPNERMTIVEYLRKGAVGYTVRQASGEEVATAILDVLNGTWRCSPEVTAELIAQLQRGQESPAEGDTQLPLTARECDVLRCLAGGMSNQEIADALVIEICTVKHHVHNILDKLKLSRRWDAGRLALSLGWTPQTPKK